MSHFLDWLRYFSRKRETFSDGHGVITDDDRQWEDGYRNRWRFDKVVRSTHGVKCTGASHSWYLYSPHRVQSPTRAHVLKFE